MSHTGHPRDADYWGFCAAAAEAIIGAETTSTRPRPGSRAHVAMLIGGSGGNLLRPVPPTPAQEIQAANRRLWAARAELFAAIRNLWNVKAKHYTYSEPP